MAGAGGFLLLLPYVVDGDVEVGEMGGGWLLRFGRLAILQQVVERSTDCSLVAILALADFLDRPARQPQVKYALVARGLTVLVDA